MGLREAEAKAPRHLLPLRNRSMMELCFSSGYFGQFFFYGLSGKVVQDFESKPLSLFSLKILNLVTLQR